MVVGVDFSWGMLSRGASLTRTPRMAGVRWVQADASALPFKAEVFDVATCAYALYELKGDSRRCMLDEVARVLTPGARFLAMEHEMPRRTLPRLLFSFRVAVIGAEGARAFLGGELQEFGRVFARVYKETLPPGKSKILIGHKSH